VGMCSAPFGLVLLHGKKRMMMMRDCFIEQL